MIPYFADPYEDELLYSAYARLWQRMRFYETKGNNLNIFGSLRGPSMLDLPSNLEYLISLLPSGHRYTIDRLIYKHTFFPFYGPFLSPDQSLLLWKDMCGDGSQRVHKHAGIEFPLLLLPERFRFCPVCVREERKQFGECYWHRIHQIREVLVCPIHEVFLEESEASIRSAGLMSPFLAAEPIIPSIIERPLDLTNCNHGSLLRIAHDVTWLLDQRELILESKSLNERCLTLFAQRTNGLPSRVEFCKVFNAYHTPEFLAMIGCSVDQQRDNWLWRLAYFGKRSYNPVRHLLLIQFLGHTIETFCSVPKNNTPFGQAPWPCLNPSSEHYGELRIKTCQIMYKHSTKRLVGIFTCDCGFVYEREGPDRESHDRYRIDGIKEYGATWEAALQHYWLYSPMKLLQVATALGVTREEVKRQASLIGLPSLRPQRSLCVSMPETPTFVYLVS